MWSSLNWNSWRMDIKVLELQSCSSINNPNSISTIHQSIVPNYSINITHFYKMRSFNLLAISALSTAIIAAPNPQSGTGVNDPYYQWSVTGWSAGCVRDCYYGMETTSPMQFYLFHTYKFPQISMSPASNTVPIQRSQHSQHIARGVALAHRFTIAAYLIMGLETEDLLQDCCQQKLELELILKSVCSGRIWSKREFLFR